MKPNTLEWWAWRLRAWSSCHLRDRWQEIHRLRKVYGCRIVAERLAIARVLGERGE